MNRLHVTKEGEGENFIFFLVRSTKKGEKWQSVKYDKSTGEYQCACEWYHIHKFNPNERLMNCCHINKCVDYLEEHGG